MTSRSNYNLPSKSRDPGDAPAMDPRSSMVSNTDVSALTMSDAANGARRAARRNKRASTREKLGRSSVTSPTGAGGLPNDMEYSDDDDDDNVNEGTPGSFAVLGPSQRLSQVSGRSPPIVDEIDNIAENTVVPEDDDNFKNVKRAPLPVAYQAELVVDYPFPNNPNVVLAATKGTAERTVPLKWLLIGGGMFFVGAVVIAVSLGVAMGTSANRSASSQANVVAPTFQPVLLPTFIPVESGQPNFAPVVPPSFAPVVPPTVDPAAPPAVAPQVPPTLEPVVAPTVAPVTIVTEPTNAPVTPVAPVQSPTTPPTNPPVAPVTAPTRTPTKPPTTPVASPTNRPNSGPSTPTSGTNVNPLYTSNANSNLKCECRYYVQEITVTDSSEWDTLNQQQINGFLQFLLDEVPSFNPYPNRRLRHLGEAQSRRELQPNQFSYSLSLDSQDLFGGVNAPPMGVSVMYLFEFCVDAPAYVGDYHAAFVDYQSQSSNINAQASTLGIASLASVSAPIEQTNKVCSK